MREFSEDVVCRCSQDVVIKQIPDQWFIKYSDYVLTKESKEHTNYMNIYPQEYKDEIPQILDWFDDRACIRKGSWLGTEFPFKDEWIVEPISDSTLYPAYYVISKYVNEGKLNPEDMSVEFFDFVFLGIGKPKDQLWADIKEDFDYWYPVDINLGGKEHKTVHFPVFIMNHVAIMPESKRPQGLFVHWWVTQKGKEKISKSKGGAEHIAEAASTYGVDAMRLYYSHVGSPFVDIEWDSVAVTKYKNRVTNIWKTILQVNELKDKSNDNLDSWLKSIMQRTIQKTIDAFESYDLRIATNEIFFETQKNLQWYLKRGGSNKEVLDEFISNWIRLMSPITPHLSEELWSIKNHDIVSIQSFPEFDSGQISEKDEVGEYLLSNVCDDIAEILKVTKIDAEKIVIYTTPKWKEDAFKDAIIKSSSGKINVGEIIKDLLSKPELKQKSKDISQFVGKLPGEVQKLSANDKTRYLIKIDEKQYLIQSIQYLKDIFNCEIEVYSSDDESIYDPAKKTRFAIPLRPAIYIE